MRPPECAICGRCDPGIGLVHFATDAAAAAWYKRAEAEGFVGHPPDQEWFCSVHLAQAQALSDLTRGEAIRRMRGGGEPRQG